MTFFKKNFFWCLFIFERETECEQEWRRERGRHRIGSRLQALSCQPRARRGARTHRPWDHDLSRSRTLNWLSHPDAPRVDLESPHHRKIVCDYAQWQVWWSFCDRSEERRVGKECQEWQTDVFNFIPSSACLKLRGKLIKRYWSKGRLGGSVG